MLLGLLYVQTVILKDIISIIQFYSYNEMDIMNYRYFSLNGLIEGSFFLRFSMLNIWWNLFPDYSVGQEYGRSTLFAFEQLVFRAIKNLTYFESLIIRHSRMSRTAIDYTFSIIKMDIVYRLVKQKCDDLSLPLSP